MKAKNPNPIYNLLKRVACSDDEAMAALRALLEHKKDAQDVRYFFIPLNVSNKVPLILQGKRYQISEHHISVYECCDERTFGLTAFHYTATLAANTGDAKLHIYFDRHNRFCDCLLQQDGQTIALKFAAENALHQLSWAHMSPVMELIVAAYNAMEKEAEVKLHEHRQCIQKLSRRVFGGGEVYAEESEARDDYISTVNDYIEVQRVFNQVAMYPDTDVICLMEETLCYVQNPPPRPLKTRAKKPDRATLGPTKPHAQPQKTVPSPKKQLQQKQDDAKLEENREQLAQLKATLEKFRGNKRPEVSTLCHWHQTLDEAIKITPDSDVTFILDCAMEQQNVVARASKRLMLSAAMGQVDAVRQLITIASVISMETIVHAALRKQLPILELLFVHYKGPMIFFYNSLNVMLSDELPVLSAISLLQHGVNPCARNLKGGTLLHQTIERIDLSWEQRSALVITLLECGADINARTQNVKVVSAMGSIQKRMNTVPMLTQGMEKPQLEAMNKVMEIIAGAVTNLSKMGHGVRLTPLMVAADVANVQLVKLLMERGADHTLTSSTGYDVFGFATMERAGPHVATPFNAELVQYLMSRCDVDISRCTYGFNDHKMKCTPLQHAVLILRPDYLEGLLRLGADPNVVLSSEVLSLPMPLPYSPILMAYTVFKNLESEHSATAFQFLQLFAKYTNPEIRFNEAEQLIIDFVRSNSESIEEMPSGKVQLK